MRHFSNENEGASSERRIDDRNETRSEIPPHANTQAAPKVHPSNKSSGLRHECTPSRLYSRKIPVVQGGQHDDPRSSRDSTVEDTTGIAQLQSQDDEGISPHVLELKSPHIVNVEVERL